MNNDFFRVVLPWPDWGISPNSRKHYQAKAKLVAEHRQIAKISSLAAMGFRNWVDADCIFSVWIFCDPDKRKRDTGNIRAACKAYQDGVFDALKIDDSAIKPEYLHREGIIKGGQIELRLYERYIEWLDDVITLSSSVYSDQQIYTVVKNNSI